MNELFHQFMQVINYQVDDGGKAEWGIFPDAHYYDHLGEYGSFGITFSTKTLEVLDLTLNSETAYDKNHNPVAYRWINPLYKTAYMAELEGSGCEEDFVDLDVELDIMEKATAVLANQDFDRRVIIPLELDDDILMALFKEAHKRDITFNQLITEILRKAVEDAGVK
jgi:hypothetical protein